MMLSPGEDWGRLALLPAGAPLANSDRDVVALLGESEPPPVIALAGGDLCRTLGGRGDVEARLGSETTVLDIDVGAVVADGSPAGWFVGHVVARRRWWRGRAVVVMNAQWMGKWNMAPRAHPGDGRLDSISGELAVRQRVLAGRLARTGAHLPHPELTQKRAPAFEFEFATPRSLRLDGARVGQCQSLRIEIASTVTVAV